MSERDRRTDDGTYPNVGEELEKLEDRAVCATKEPVSILGAGDSLNENYGAWHIITATNPETGKPGASLTFKRNGDVIFNDRKIVTDGEIVAAMRTLARIVVACEHKDRTRFGDTEWCGHCGAFWVNGSWRSPSGVRW